MHKPTIYVINLARSLDRLKSILTELRAVNVMHPRIITAYDGHAPDFPFHLYQHLAGPFWGDPARFKPGAFATYLSHVACWCAIAESHEPYGLILEDDVAIQPQPFTAFALANLPEDFDLLFINAGMQRWHPLLWQQANGAEGTQNGDPFTAVSPLLRQLIVQRLFTNTIAAPGAYGYLVSRAGATKLLAMVHSRKICMGVDYAMVFQSLTIHDMAVIAAVGSEKLPKSLRFFLPKEEAHLVVDGPLTLNSYVYTPAPVVTIKPFPSMIRHGVYLESSRFASDSTIVSFT